MPFWPCSAHVIFCLLVCRWQFQQRWQIIWSAAGNGSLNNDCRAVFAQRPQQHCQGTEKQVQTELCWLYGPLKVVSGIWEYQALRHQNEEKKVFCHFCVVSGWTCPYTQPLLCTLVWKKVSDKHQNAPLLMTSRTALCSYSTLTEGSLCSPSSSKPRTEPCDKRWGCTSRRSHRTHLSPLIPSSRFLSLWAGRAQGNISLPRSEGRCRDTAA